MECTLSYFVKSTRMTSHLFLENIEGSVFPNSNVNIDILPLLDNFSIPSAENIFQSKYSTMTSVYLDKSGKFCRSWIVKGYRCESGGMPHIKCKFMLTLPLSKNKLQENSFQIIKRLIILILNSKFRSKKTLDRNLVL